MKYSEVKNYVKKEITKFLKPYGFTYDAKAYSFIKVTETGSIGVITPIANYEPLFKLGFSFTIRISSVEDIYNKFGRILPPFQKYSSTIIVQYDYFKDKKYFEYHFYNESELAFALKDFQELFGKTILPFLNGNADLQKLRDLVENHKIFKVDSTAIPDNFMHWLIIAKLTILEANELISDKLIEYLQQTDVEQDKKRIIQFLKYMDVKGF